MDSQSNCWANSNTPGQPRASQVGGDDERRAVCWCAPGSHRQLAPALSDATTPLCVPRGGCVLLDRRLLRVATGAGSAAADIVSVGYRAHPFLVITGLPLGIH
jgi:hypothetical protein